MTYNAETLYSEGETGYAELMREWLYRVMKAQLKTEPQTPTQRAESFRTQAQTYVDSLSHCYNIHMQLSITDGHRVYYTVEPSTTH